MKYYILLLLIISIVFNFFIRDLSFNNSVTNVIFQFVVSMFVGFGISKFKKDIEKYWLKSWLFIYVFVVVVSVVTYYLDIYQ